MPEIRLSNSKIGKILAETAGLSIGDVLAHYPIVLSDLFDFADEINKPIKEDSEAPEALVKLKRICVQGWINDAYPKAPEVAERLDRELSSEVNI